MVSALSLTATGTNYLEPTPVSIHHTTFCVFLYTFRNGHSLNAAKRDEKSALLNLINFDSIFKKCLRQVFTYMYAKTYDLCSGESHSQGTIC